MSEEETAHPADYSPSQRRAWAEALDLAHLQVEVLTQLHDADRRADDAEVRRCVAALDHVMAQVAAAEQARSNAGEGEAALAADGAALDELACASCGALAQPVYDTPRLLGYRCPRCEWTADDPAAQAAQRLDAARKAAAVQVRETATAIRSALANLRQRRRKQHEQGLQDLEAALASLDAIAKRVGRAEEQLRAAQRTG
jgi:hypothetical protein